MSREWKKNITHIDPKQSTPLHKNTDNASTKDNTDNSEDNSLTALTRNR